MAKTDYKKESKKLENPTIAETIKSMQGQLASYTKKAEYYNTMALKAQGAIEVLTQLEGKDK